MVGLWGERKINKVDDEGSVGKVSRFDKYRELRAEITYEANLAVGRTSWFVASQAFLFTSLAAAIRRTGDDVIIADSLLFPLIPLIGIGVSLLTLMSVGAALIRAWSISSKIREEFHRFVEEFKIRESGGTAFFGSFSTVMIPVSFLFIWIYLLADQWYQLFARASS